MLPGADHPGTGAVLDNTATCAARWALGTAPDADQDLDTWRAWLHPSNTTTASTPAARTALALALGITATAGHTLPGLLDCHRQDTASWEHLVTRVQAGWNWRTPDSRTEAALGLATRCDAAELYASLRLRNPLTAHAAAHDGYVVQGTITAVDGTDLTVTATRALCRLRTGAPIEGRPGTALACPADGRDTTDR